MQSLGERLARIEAILEELRHDLLGNGTPGRINLMEARISALEKLRWMILGALILLGLVTGSNFLPRILARL